MLTAGNSRCNRSSICANIRSGCRYRINCRTILNRRNINTKARRQCIFNFIANQVFNSIACVALFLTIISLFCFAAFNNNLNFSFPYCEDSIIRKVFIRSNLRNLSCCSFLIILSIFIIDIRITQFLCPVGIVSFPSSRFSRCCRRIGRTGIDELPPQELISCSGRNTFSFAKAMNAYSFINLKFIVCTESFVSIVHEPTYMCVCWTFNRNILSPKSDSIYLLLNALTLPTFFSCIYNIPVSVQIVIIIILDIYRIFLFINSGNYLCICCKYSKVLSCIDRLKTVIINKAAICILLHNPVTKPVSCGCCYCCRCISCSTINIHMTIRWRISFRSTNLWICQAISNINAICTQQCCTPLGIQIQFSCNPPAGLIRRKLF